MKTKGLDKGESSSESPMPRITTIPKAARHLRENYPDSAISESLIRRLVKEGKVPSQKVGSRFYLDENKILEIFSQK